MLLKNQIFILPNLDFKLLEKSLPKVQLNSFCLIFKKYNGLIMKLIFNR